MKSLKYIIFILLVSVLALVFISRSKTEAPISSEFNIENTQGQVIDIQDTLGQIDEEKLKGLGIEIDKENSTVAATFIGTLTEVNTGCFADGECFAVIDGKKVIAIEGWKQGPVGRTIIEGNENAGFGDLYLYIDKSVEVYAAINTDGVFTLYGSENYYIKTL